MSKFYTDVSIHRGKIIHSYYSNGNKYISKEDYCPQLFIASNKNTSNVDLFGNNMEQINLNSIKEYNDYKKNYGDVMELYGSISPMYQFLSDEYKGKTDFNLKDIRTLLYDIEVINIKNDPNLNGFPRPEVARVPVVSVAIKDRKTKIMWVLSLVDYEPEHTKLKLDCKTIKFKKFKNEESLLMAFVLLIENLQPDVLIGWFNKGFDDSYILNRIDQLLGEDVLKRLSPCKSVSYSFNENKYGKIEPKVTIKGLQILDYLELYKKFIPGGKESYSLNFISKLELGETKVDYQEFDNLKDFFLTDPQSAIDYNIYDVELIDLIDKKLGLIELVFTIAYMTNVNFEDVLSPIRTWDAFIYNYLKDKNIVIPPNKQNIKEDYPGAYVHEPETKIYNWVMTYDLASLYPHLIMGHNISTETIVDKVEHVNQKTLDDRIFNKEIVVDKNYIFSGSGQYFRKDKKGFLPEMMESLFNERKAIKKEMIEYKKQYEKTKDESLVNIISTLNNKQLAFKILLNSVYGGMGSAFFRYYDIRLAKAITMSGQMAIKYAANNLQTYVKNKFNVDHDVFIGGDTDSFFFTFDFVSDKLKEKDPKKIVDVMDKFSNKYIEPVIEKLYDELALYMNVNEQKMFMEREKIIEKMLITGKKRYAYLLWDDEGVRYDDAQFKVTGFEIVRSSTPNIIKPYLKDSIITLMNDPENIHSYIQKVKSEFMEMSVEDIAFPRSVSNVKKYLDKAAMYKKGCPIAVRAAIMYNEYIKKHDMEIQEIGDGDKIKFFYTLTPNSFFNSNVFGYSTKIPNREDIVKYADYSMQFEKVYFSVIKNITDKIGINLEKKVQTDLSDLF